MAFLLTPTELKMPKAVVVPIKPKAQAKRTAAGAGPTS